MLQIIVNKWKFTKLSIITGSIAYHSFYLQFIFKFPEIIIKIKCILIKQLLFVNVEFASKDIIIF